MFVWVLAVPLIRVLLLQEASLSLQSICMITWTLLAPPPLLKNTWCVYQKQPPKLFFKKISKISLGKWWSLFLIKLIKLKRDSNTGAFLWNLWNFWEHQFWRTSANDCFWYTNIRMHRLEPWQLSPTSNRSNVSLEH